MKTPDEIKRGLECCMMSTCEPSCPYGNPVDCGFMVHLMQDALALIQQLQADNAQLNRCIENMTDKLNAMNDEVAKRIEDWQRREDRERELRHVYESLFKLEERMTRLEGKGMADGKVREVCTYETR